MWNGARDINLSGNNTKNKRSKKKRQKTMINDYTKNNIDLYEYHAVVLH